MLERSYKYSRNEIMDVVVGLVSAAELHVETVQRAADILPLFQNEGFGRSDLMISQAAIRSGGHVLQTFDRKAAKLAGVILLGTSH